MFDRYIYSKKKKVYLEKNAFSTFFSKGNIELNITERMRI